MRVRVRVGAGAHEDRVRVRVRVRVGAGAHEDRVRVRGQG